MECPGVGKIGLTGLGLAIAWLAAGCSPDPQALIDRAQAAMEANRPDEAAEALERLAEVRQPTTSDRLMRADVARTRDRLDEALAELDQIPDDDPKAPVSWLMRGQIEIRRQRLRPAEAALRRVLERFPDQVQARRELIFIVGQQMRRGELIGQVETLARLVPLTYDDVWLWCMAPDLLGWVPEENIGVLEAFLKADPADRWTRLALADQFRRMSRYDDAEATLAPLPDTDLDARVIRARLAFDRGDLDTAERLVKEGPSTQSDLARLRGRLALARRDAPAAIAAYRAAEAADPGHRETAYGLGQALRLTGNPEADHWLETARQLDELGSLLERAGTPPGRADADLPRRLGAAYEALGRLPQARAWYRLAIARDPLDTEAQQALHRLGASAGPALFDTPDQSFIDK
jgi:tetratricopeptide (TPR) repeat protein